MTKQDYELIAGIVKHIRGLQGSIEDPQHALDVISRSLATTLAARNPRFDEERFLVACGVSNPTQEKE